MNVVYGVTRRTMLGALTLPWLVSGCSTPLPLTPPPAGDADAVARVRDSAQAHGLQAYRRLTDINVSYTGQWRPLIGRIQPELVDPGFRGGSQERLMPQAGVIAQAHTGPMGNKQVIWRRGGQQGRAGDLGDVSVWFNGVRSTDPASLDTAALVAEGYGLFLTGPLWLVDRDLRMSMGGTERVDGRQCDVVDVWLTPGLGRVAADRLSLCIDRADGLVHRLRFTLEGFANTQGAVAQVDSFEHQRRFGVVWPTRWYERVLHPIPLPAHDWVMTGLDVNRGYGQGDLLGPSFAGAAAAAAKALNPDGAS